MKSQFAHSSVSNQAYWLLPSSSRQSRFFADALRSASAKLSGLSNRLISKLSASSDPYVWETHNAEGEIAWSAEDPLSGRAIFNVSEAEMRVWLEGRYQF